MGRPMTPVAVIGTLLVGAAVVALAIILVRFNLKRRHVARCAASATPEQLEHVYTLVEQTGTTASNGCVLARTNRSTGETRCLVPLPRDLPEFPWAGELIEVTASTGVEFRFVDAIAAEPTILGRVYRPVRVPRHQTKHSAKAHNTFAPERYVASSTQLQTALRAVCPAYPAELLAYLLCAGRESFEFEPVDQARIGTSPAWVQDAENPVCPECRKRMHLVLQLPGALVGDKAFRRGTFYFFGCVTHPHRTASLGQFT